MATIGNMTVDELRKFVETTIDERLVRLLGGFDLAEAELFTDDTSDTRTWEQVKQDIERDRWTPPPGAKSALELLREDRNG